MRPLSCSSRSYAVVNRKSNFSIFTAKLNAADYLANLGHSYSYSLHILDSQDRGLSH
ncbi:hypothetical protein LINGRAHAP2_LOCUS22742 [Linum grandiflorum]